jgi:hypothetical protein
MWGCWRLLSIWAAMKGDFVTSRILGVRFGALCALEGELVGNRGGWRRFVALCPLVGRGRERWRKWSGPSMGL